MDIETQHTGEFLLSEANGTLSRQNVTLLSGQNLGDGAVLGKVTASGKYKEFDPAAVDGSQTAAAILFGDINATAGDQAAAVIDAVAEVISAKLVWKAGVTSGQKTTALASLRTQLIKAL